jgi:hypothetical protein
MAGLNYQKQLAGMKKLRDMLVKARRFADGLDEYILGGKSASVSIVEANLDTSVSQMEKMIADLQKRQSEKIERMIDSAEEKFEGHRW